MFLTKLDPDSHRSKHTSDESHDEELEAAESSVMRLYTCESEGTQRQQEGAGGGPGNAWEFGPWH